jgi:N-acetylglucosamine malate deacetylase 1
MNYLFISAHTDDVELACGGTIAKLKEQGHIVTVITLSCKFDVGNLTNEWVAAMKVLWVDKVWLNDFKPRYFWTHRQEILQYLIMQEHYDYVFTHSEQDTHQDHKVVGEESFRAFKRTNLVTFMGNWNTRSINNNYFVSLEKHHVEKKIEALACYKSQKDKPYMHHDFIWADVLNNGVMCGVKYAEAFKLINYVG